MWHRPSSTRDGGRRETLPARSRHRDGLAQIAGNRDRSGSQLSAEGIVTRAYRPAGYPDMRLLVLGGTRFLGRAIVEDAISRGYDVTTFSRGLSGHPRPGAEALHGDRTSAEDLRQLAGRDWDAVIDTSTIAPVHVAASAQLLAGHVGHYSYVSTISVYQDRPGEPITEASPVVDCSPDASGTAETLDYPELKAGSERAVQEAMPGRNLITRP